MASAWLKGKHAEKLEHDLSILFIPEIITFAGSDHCAGGSVLQVRGN